MDTIFACSTAPGKAGVAVIRVSGPKSRDVIEKITKKPTPKPRYAALRNLSDPDTDEILDQALVLFFPSPQSFTGEDCAEFQIHGSIAAINGVLAALARCAGCRPAEAGEFTQRALVNNQVDLAQVEGLSTLLNAETLEQHRQAMRIFGGELSGKVSLWRENLLSAMALLEASIDFSDEELPDDLMPDVEAALARIETALTQELAGADFAQRLASGFEIAIVGRPNVGKSTLLNALAGRDAAIVSEISGTTRDVIEARLDIGGFAVTFLDTAGIRETTDQIEEIGVARAITRATEADLRIFLIETPYHPIVAGIERRDCDIILVSKADQCPTSGSISAKTGHGLDALISDIKDHFARVGSDQSSLITLRHKAAVSSGADEIRRAQGLLSDGAEAEIVAEHIRRANHHLGSITGQIGVEDVLGEIFSSFCIGK